MTGLATSGNGQLSAFCRRGCQNHSWTTVALCFYYLRVSDCFWAVSFYAIIQNGRETQHSLPDAVFLANHIHRISLTCGADGSGADATAGHDATDTFLSGTLSWDEADES